MYSSEVDEIAKRVLVPEPEAEATIEMLELLNGIIDSVSELNSKVQELNALGVPMTVSVSTINDYGSYDSSPVGIDIRNKELVDYLHGNRVCGKVYFSGLFAAHHVPKFKEKERSKQNEA